jgi:hypothetical protein
LQQYFVQLNYNGGNGLVANNTMVISTTPYTLSLTVISNTTYSLVVPTAPVEPTPDPTVDDGPTNPNSPDYDPTSGSTSMSEATLILIIGGSVTGLLLLIVIIMCMLSWKNGLDNSTESAEGLVYE